jgi:hypothetical protein
MSVRGIYVVVVLAVVCILADTRPAIAETNGGTGLFSAISEGDSGLPSHTIYRPSNLNTFGQNQELPVVAWANGACMNSSKEFSPFLTEIASHGFLVIAIGPYTATSGQGETKSSQLLDALNWATAENARKDSKYYQKIDPSKFAVMGQSCGGLQAMEVSFDPRVTTTIMWNSGLFDAANMPKMDASKMPGGAGNGGPGGSPSGNGPGGAQGAGPGGPQGGNGRPQMGKMPVINLTKDDLKKLHAPILYVGGGSTDIAYGNMQSDYERINQVPVFMAQRETGHMGTYSQKNGGAFAAMGAAWLEWQLKGDQEAKKMFVGESCGFCTAEGWTT